MCFVHVPDEAPHPVPAALETPSRSMSCDAHQTDRSCPYFTRLAKCTTQCRHHMLMFPDINTHELHKACLDKLTLTCDSLDHTMCLGHSPTWGVAATEVGPSQAASAQCKGDHPCITIHRPIHAVSKLQCARRDSIICDMALTNQKYRLTHIT